MKKLGNSVYMIVCMIVCLLPLVGMIFYKTDSTTENRTLASMPSVMKDDKVNVSFLKELGGYFEDHFAFRQELVSADAEIQSKVFHVSNVDTVMVGEDDWLYYTDTLDDFLGRNVMSERQLYCTAHNLSLLQRYVNAQGVPFVFTVAPNKNTLYPEHMPYYTERKADTNKNIDLLKPVLENCGVEYVDLFPLFEEQNETLYLKRDSHWNNKGAVLAYDVLLDELQREHETYESVKAIRTKTAYGDLNKMIYPLTAKPEWDYYYQNEKQWTYTSEEENVEAAWIQTKNEDGSGSLLMFRDSFGNTLLPLMAQEFSDAAFSKGVPYRIEEYMKKCEPEFVIVEKVERNLDEYMHTPPVMHALEVDLSDAHADVQDGATLDVQVADEDVQYYCLSGELSESVANSNDNIYIRLQIGDTAKVYEAFTTVDENTDYCYRMYLSKTQLVSDGLGTGEVSVNVFVGADALEKKVCTKQVNWDDFSLSDE